MRTFVEMDESRFTARTPKFARIGRSLLGQIGAANWTTSELSKSIENAFEGDESATALTVYRSMITVRRHRLGPRFRTRRAF